MATQQILLDTETLALGRFVCPPGDARWSRENWIGPEHHVVFPARAVLIDQAGIGRVVANANHAVMYDADRTYRRELVSPDGDLATFVVLREALVREVLGVDDAQTARFPHPDAWLPADAVLRLQVLARALERARTDTLTAEGIVLELVGDVLRAARSTHAGNVATRASTQRAHGDLVHDAKAVLSVRFAENLRLADIARAVGASPYHLARVFRSRTGQSLHAYREQVRLRIALERLLRPDASPGLASLASEVGYASLSHLDHRFRRTFGWTPAEVRAMGAGAGGHDRMAQMRTILQGQVHRPA